VSRSKPKNWAAQAAEHGDAFGHAVMMADDGAWCDDCGHTWRPKSLEAALPNGPRPWPTSSAISPVPYLLGAGATPDLPSIASTCSKVNALLQIARAGDVDPRTLVDELEGVQRAIAELARLAAS